MFFIPKCIYKKEFIFNVLLGLDWISVFLWIWMCFLFGFWNFSIESVFLFFLFSFRFENPDFDVYIFKESISKNFKLFLLSMFCGLFLNISYFWSLNDKFALFFVLFFVVYMYVLSFSSFSFVSKINLTFAAVVCCHSFKLSFIVQNFTVV